MVMAHPRRHVRITLRLSGEQCLLRRTDDGWTHSRPFGQDIWALLRHGQPFREDAHEILDYWAQVTVDMLNAGDVDGNDSAHLQTIHNAVQRSGYWFGLNGAWKVRREMKLVKPRDRLLFVTAYVRCGQYLLEATNAGTIRAPKRLGVVNCKLEICSDWWMDGKIANGDWFLSVEDEDSYYMGIDGLMPGRFVDLEIAGQTLLASPTAMRRSRSGSLLGCRLPTRLIRHPPLERKGEPGFFRRLQNERPCATRTL